MDSFRPGRASVSQGLPPTWSAPPSPISPEAHAVAWAAGPGIQDHATMLAGAARMIEATEAGRRAWRALALISVSGWGATAAALAVTIWG